MKKSIKIHYCSNVIVMIILNINAKRNFKNNNYLLL